MNKLYLNGIYQAKSSSIYDDDIFDNLRQLNNEQLFEYLKNDNYGIGSDYNNIDSVIYQELINIRKELESLSGTKLLGDIFYMNSDLINIKIVIKSLEYDLPIENFDPLSKFKIDALVEFFKNGNKSLIQEEDLKILTILSELESVNIKQQLEMIEKTYFDYYYNLVKNKFPELLVYLDTNNFSRNLLNFIKVRNRNGSKEELESLLLEQSVFDKNNFLDLLNDSNDDVVKTLELYYDGKLVNGLTEFFNGGTLNKLEEAINEVTKDIMQNLNYNHQTLGPVYYYLYLKNYEANKIRGVYYE